MMDDDLHGKQQAQHEVRVPPELDDVIRTGVKAARLVPGSVATGGTVCSLYANHRLSLDIDFFVSDFRERFQEVRETLDAEEGWSLQRQRPPVLILGTLDKVPIGYRQLKRPFPLEQLAFATADGVFPIPTLEEMISIKAYLASERFYVRDFYDFAELTLLTSRQVVVQSLIDLDSKWSSPREPTVALQVMKTLADCNPVDEPEDVFKQLRFLAPQVRSWNEVVALCQEIATELSSKLIRE